MSKITDADIDEALGSESGGGVDSTAGDVSGEGNNYPAQDAIQGSVVQDTGVTSPQGDTAASGRELARRPSDLVAGQIRIGSKEELTALAKSLHAAGRQMGEARDVAGLYLALLAGTEAGLTVSQSIKNVAVIRGNATIWGDAFTALVLAHDEYAGHVVSWPDEYQCEVVVKRCKRLWNGEAAMVEHTEHFGEDDARRMNLWGKGGPWSSAPKRMLRHRCVGYAFRELFADVLGGLSIREEVDDYGGFEPEKMRGPVVDDSVRARVIEAQEAE